MHSLMRYNCDSFGTYKHSSHKNNLWKHDYHHCNLQRLPHQQHTQKATENVVLQLCKEDDSLRHVKRCHWGMPLLPTLIHPTDKTGAKISCQALLHRLLFKVFKFLHIFTQHREVSNCSRLGLETGLLTWCPFESPSVARYHLQWLEAGRPDISWYLTEENNCECLSQKQR